MKKKSDQNEKTTEKKSALHSEEMESAEGFLTTNQGVRVSDDDNSLTAGPRGPTLLEDFHFREKMTHFDHERIPERIVHPRGSAAHGIFKPYRSFSDYTCAGFLQDPKKETAVFVRFSTVVGFRGSADTVRDVRGFATKFYTEEGNYDLVGNNMPVFFIQDAIKFPDLVHSIKPEPHNEMPQAAAAHDNFWDFISLTPESAHMIMWVLSDRALPRSYSQMDGFGVHTFRFVTAEGVGRFVKLHWRPVNGVYSMVFDEAQKVAGKDPDFHRRDLWNSIEKGNYPEFELCAQFIDEKDEHRFDYDLLDPTKLVPEEDVPLVPLGKMTLNRNPDNFFAETEQVAFHPGNVVRGIDVTNDPLLQGRLFSYLDTQLIRLGGPNFTEIPINRPIAPVHNNQRDGHMRQTIHKGRVNYSPNTLGGGCPFHAMMKQGGYVHYTEKVEGRKVRERSESFKDHFSQATLFWNSMTPFEQRRIIEAASFELGKVESKDVRKRVVDEILNPTDHEMAKAVAKAIGVPPPKSAVKPNHGRRSPTLSIEHRKVDHIRGRKIAVLAMPGVDSKGLKRMQERLDKEKAEVEVISEFAGELLDENEKSVMVDKTFLTTAAVLYDAVYLPGGKEHLEALSESDMASEFLTEVYRHHKPIVAAPDAVDVLHSAGLPMKDKPEGVLLSEDPKDLVDALLQARFWSRPTKRKSSQPWPGSASAEDAGAGKPAST